MSSDDCKTWPNVDLVESARCQNGRRQNERFPCGSFLTGSLFFPRSGKTLEVLAFDLSIKGIGVTALENVEVPQEAVILLKRTNAESTIPFQTRVIHCTKDSDGRFRIGCHFEERIDSVLWEYLIGW